jgi:peptidyl-prolyl cis-trans isomerase C
MSLHRITARLAALACVLAGTTLAAPASRADTPGSAVVARVGKRVITAADLERRIANVPAFQLRSFGKTPEAIRKAFLENVLVREALFAEGALAEGLAERDDVAERVRAVLRNTVVAALREQASKDATVTDQEVKAFYDANASKFHSPPRLALWRIQVATKAEAAAVLDEAKKDLSPKRWNDLAREKSLDKTTSLRGGNLGFVEPSGATGEQGVSVDPALFEAGSKVKDSELVPEPVKDGERWSVVWRRQSMKPVDRPLDMEASSIRQVLAHEKSEARIKSTLAVLRKQYVTDVRPELVDLIEISATGELSPMKRPGVLPTSRAAGPMPNPGPGGLR